MILRAARFRPLLVSLLLAPFASLALLACSESEPTPAEQAPPPSSRTDGGVAEAEEAGRTIADASRPGKGEAGTLTTAVTGGFVAKGATMRIRATAKLEDVADIVLANVADVCSAERGSGATNVLHLTLRAERSLALGTYPIVIDTTMGGSGAAPQGTAVLWSVSDVGGDACTLNNTDAMSGSVTLTYVGDERIDGTIDLALESNGTKVSGSFAAPLCGAVGSSSVACPLGR